MHFLNPRSGRRGYREQDVHQGAHLTIIRTDEAEPEAAPAAHAAERVEHVGRPAAGADRHDHVGRPGQCIELAGENLVEFIIIGHGGDDRGVDRQGDGGDARTVQVEAAHELAAPVDGVRSGPTVPEDVDASALSDPGRGLPRRPRHIFSVSVGGRLVQPAGLHKNVPNSIAHYGHPTEEWVSM